MSLFIDLLEKQRKRELKKTVDLPARGKNLQWLTLQGLETQAKELYEQISYLLPNNVNLERTGVDLQTYGEARPATTLRFMAQVSATNHRGYLLKVHCHEINPKGNWRKLAKAEYHYRERRLPA